LFIVLGPAPAPSEDGNGTVSKSYMIFNFS
jgi:hypothetical protein